MVEIKFTSLQPLTSYTNYDGLEQAIGFHKNDFCQKIKSQDYHYLVTDIVDFYKILKSKNQQFSKQTNDLINLIDSTLKENNIMQQQLESNDNIVKLFTKNMVTEQYINLFLNNAKTTMLGHPHALQMSQQGMLTLISKCYNIKLELYKQTSNSKRKFLKTISLTSEKHPERSVHINFKTDLYQTEVKAIEKLSRNAINLADKKEITQSFKGNDTKKILNLLYESSNDELKGQYGETALHWACFNLNESLAIILCKRRVNINSQDSRDHRTPLHWVVLRMLHNPINAQRIINLLFSYNPNLNLKDHNNMSVPQYLEQCQSTFKNVTEKILNQHDSYLEEQNITYIGRDGDDSSDEEEVDKRINEYSNSYLNTLDKSTPQNTVYLLIINEISLKILYHKETNKLYYHSSGFKKFLLGGNYIQYPEHTKDWIVSSLEMSLKILLDKIGHGTPASTKKDKLINSFANLCVENPRLFLKNSRLTMASKNKVNTVKSIAEKYEIQALRNKRCSLKGKWCTTIVNERPDQLSDFIVEKRSPDKAKDSIDLIELIIKKLQEKLLKQPQPYTKENEEYKGINDQNNN